jgi:hypothetical protein
MAAVTAPAQVSVQHQKLLHFVGEGKWSDESVLAKVRELVMPAIERHGPIKAWIIDDASYPKQGTHSVGVHHQYCGQLGKQANCQVAVTLSIANHHASLPIAYRLYLPKDWADDAERRNKAHVPEAIRFKIKPQIALGQLGAARCRPSHRQPPVDALRGPAEMPTAVHSHIASFRHHSFHRGRRRSAILIALAAQPQLPVWRRASDFLRLRRSRNVVFIPSLVVSGRVVSRLIKSGPVKAGSSCVASRSRHIKAGKGAP